MDALEFDCNLVYANCAKYNLPGSDIVKLALSVSDRLVQAIKAISEPGGGGGSVDDGAAAGGRSSATETNGAAGGGSGSGSGSMANGAVGGAAGGQQRPRQRSGSRDASAAVRWHDDDEEGEEEEDGEGGSRYARQGKRKRARTGRGASDSGTYICMYVCIMYVDTGGGVCFVVVFPRVFFGECLMHSRVCRIGSVLVFPAG